jgi:glucose/arabinose dehydrogenase
MRFRVLTVPLVMVAALTAGCTDIANPPEPMTPLAAHSAGHASLASVVSAGPALGLALVADGLTSPVALASAPDGSGRLFVADQIGLIRVIDAGGLRAEPFLDLRPRMVTLMPNFDERGLLGLAFHPEFAANGRFFVYYSAPPRLADHNHTSRVAEFLVSTDPDVADPGSETIILEVDQPQFNHNAGMLAFGPQDGYLYIALGDGGGANDTGFGHVEDWYEANAGGNGQAFDQNLLGSILRIDVDGGSPYAVPPDNPFVGDDGLDEIWAFGFRNPWRMSFDMGGNRALLVADVGQLLWEEVNVVVRGGNYGWNVREGLSCFNAAASTSPFDDCPTHDPRGEPLLDPVIAYANSFQPGGLGTAVVGGHVYRGADVPQLRGRYIFGDWSRSFGTPDGSVFLASPGGRLWNIQQIGFPDRGGRIGHYVLGFGQDPAGEVYVLTSDSSGPRDETGRVYRLTRTGIGG